MSLNRRALVAILLLVGAPQVFGLDARIRARVAGDGPFWIGQRIVVEVDLLSTGVAFSGQRFDVPELPGVVLLAPAGATLNLTERIDGADWQGLRYELSLFVLQPGRLALPPVGASFAVAAAFGETPRNFELKTEALAVAVAVPPGVRDPAMLLTTPSLERTVTWEPEPSAALEVGDALTLTVRRRAADVPGAAIPPLALEAPAGIAMYPDAPGISDRSGRGTLAGERVDRFSFVLQTPGDYVIQVPAQQWYDPKTATLHDEEATSLEFSVVADPDATVPAVAPADGLGASPAQRPHPLPWLAAALFAVLAFAVGRWLVPRLRARIGAARAARSASEVGRFEALLLACRHGEPAEADRAARAWLQAVRGGGATLTGFAAADPELSASVAGLQQALAEGRKGWSGAGLAVALERARTERIDPHRERRQRALPPLNPTAMGESG